MSMLFRISINATSNELVGRFVLIRSPQNRFISMASLCVSVCVPSMDLLHHLWPSKNCRIFLFFVQMGISDAPATEAHAILRVKILLFQIIRGRTLRLCTASGCIFDRTLHTLVNLPLISRSQQPNNPKRKCGNVRRPTTTRSQRK